MRKVMISVMSVAMLVAVATGVALAQTAPAQTPGQTTGQMPSVSNLKAFSIEANFMSLPGYLRYLMHQQTGQWMTYAEAQRAVKQGQ